jgi:superfamily II DNA or RNA helicase
MFETRTAFDVDLSTVRRAVGGGSYAAGTHSRWRRTVRDISWNPATAVLRGTVLGEGNPRYYVEADFMPGTRPARFARGQCGCGPWGACRHVVALIWAALPASTTDLAAAVPAPRPEAPSLEGSWDRLPSRRGPTADVRRAVLLAIEVELDVRPGHAPRLLSRLVERVPGCDWLYGDLTWGTLKTAGRRDNYPVPQVELLRELYALGRAGGRDLSGDLKHPIDLSTVDADQFWELLDEAAKLNLPLVQAKTGEELLASQEGRLHLDIVARRPAGGYRMTPVVLTADLEPVAPVAFIGGEQAHGAVCRSLAQATDRPGNWRLRLVRLARPVPAGLLQEQALDGRPLEIRAGEEFAFRTRQYPWLRQHADVISSDGSFVPPVISAPKLTLSIYPGPAGEVQLRWGWEYEVDGQPVQSEFERRRNDEEYRSGKAEDELLRHLDLPLERYGLGFSSRSGASHPQLIPQMQLADWQAFAFLTELLPELAAEPRVRVKVIRDGTDDHATTRSQRSTAATDELTGISDWFDLDVPVSVAGHVVPLRLVFLALHRGFAYLELPSGACLPLDRPELEGLARLIRESRALVDPDAETKSRYFDERVNGLAALDPAGEQDAWRKRWQDWLAQGVRRVDPPAGLRPELKPHEKLQPHQQRGFEWLVSLWEHQLGGILADEMGLGKTLQCLALISLVRAREPDGKPVLVVVPTSVLHNWVDEILKFTPDMSVVPLTETIARHGESLDVQVENADIVLTTYTLLRLDFDHYKELDWSILFLDEAQNVKNLEAQTYGRVRQLRSRVKIPVTGTPLENNLEELWSLLSIAAPGLFPSPDEFHDEYAHPVVDRGDQQRLAQLRRHIDPLILRRTKEKAGIYLPVKREHVLEVDLDPWHREVYETWLQRQRQKNLGEDGKLVNRYTALCSLTLLRQLCLHASLIDNDAYADLSSAKIDLLVERLHELASSGHRALVFSQFARFLGKVRTRLAAEDLTCCYLDGKTHGRRQAVAAFEAGAAPVFLISLKAGGTGLNLTQADHCFLLDPWWNPAIEAQAVARIHRIGQTRDVNVYRLIARDTVEEKVRVLQTRKGQLFDSVLDGGRTLPRGLEDDDLRKLFD